MPFDEQVWGELRERHHLNRLDTVDTVGKVLEGVLGETIGVRPAALDVGVPYTTTRGWIRSFFPQSLVCETHRPPTMGEESAPSVSR